MPHSTRLAILFFSIFFMLFAENILGDEIPEDLIMSRQEFDLDIEFEFPLKDQEFSQQGFYIKASDITIYFTFNSLKMKPTIEHGKVKVWFEVLIKDVKVIILPRGKRNLNCLACRHRE